MIHRQKKGICFMVLLILLSLLILGTRLIFLSSDAAGHPLDIEEKPVGYNARNLILFGDRDSGGGRYQPLALFPISHLLSYLSFSMLGVGLFQLRLPIALIGIFSCYLLYLIFKREYGGFLALLGTGLYSFNFFILFINRTALPENLFLLFTFLLILFLQKAEESPRYFFWVGFFAVLNLIAKLNGAIILIVTVCYLAYLSLIKKINYQAINKFLFGLIAGLLLGVMLFFGLGLKEYIPNYLWYINSGIIYGETDYNIETLEDSRGLDLSIIATQGGRYFITRLRRVAANFEKMLYFYRKTIPGPFPSPPLYLILFLVTLPVIFRNFKKLNRVTIFILFFFILGHLQITSCALFWKRMIIVMPTIIFIILQGLHFLKEKAQEARGYRLFLALLLLFSLFIIGDELGKFSVTMLRRRTYCQFQNSKELGQIIPPTTIVGDEILFRFLGYGNRHKFIFCHGGGPIGHEENIEKVISRRDIRYFGLFWHDELKEDIKDNIFQYREDLNRIKRAYSHMELVKIFDFRGCHIAIWDKYPKS